MKRALLIIADLCLAAYIVVAVCAFNKPEDGLRVCRQLEVTVSDASTHGFITQEEVANRLEKAGLNPVGRPLSQISCRTIEETLLKTPFVKTAECYRDEGGKVNVCITQRMPIVRIKADNNDDFYIDDHDCIMPNSDYTSDLIIATGNISRDYATAYISPLAQALMGDDLSRNLIQQINVTPHLGVELVPRIGNHVVYLGKLPESQSGKERARLISEFVSDKMKRLRLFYKYGLTTVGWNKYSQISLEFDNQIVCTR